MKPSQNNIRNSSFGTPGELDRRGDFILKPWKHMCAAVLEKLAAVLEHFLQELWLPGLVTDTQQDTG